MIKYAFDNVFECLIQLSGEQTKFWRSTKTLRITNRPLKGLESLLKFKLRKLNKITIKNMRHTLQINILQQLVKLNFKNNTILVY